MNAMLTGAGAMDGETSEAILAEIRLMARADHAHRLTRESDPYPKDSDRSTAWNEGWQAEEDAEHRLGEEMAKLPYFRVRTHIVTGERELAEIDREDWQKYTVYGGQEAGEAGHVFQSVEARDAFPEHKAVHIRVTYERNPKGGLA